AERMTVARRCIIRLNDDTRLGCHWQRRQCFPSIAVLQDGGCAATRMDDGWTWRPKIGAARRRPQGLEQASGQILTMTRCRPPPGPGSAADAAGNGEKVLDTRRSGTREGLDNG